MSPSLQLSEPIADKMTPHQIITALQSTMNAHDEEGLVALFSRDAFVRDGGLRYSGLTGIRCWIQDCFERYDLSIKILAVSGENTSWHFEATVAGNFEGSPVRLDHYLTIEEGNISSLEI
jgi:hypothetical protein